MIFIEKIKKTNLIKSLNRHKLLLILVLLISILAIVNRNFFNSFNIRSILNLSSITGFIVIGEALVIITKGIDISVGKIASLSTVILSASMIFFQRYFNNPMVILLSVILTILGSAIIGILNGFFITKLKISPLISTLIGLWLATGIAEYIQKGRPTSLAVDSFNKISNEALFGVIPYSTIVLIVFLIIFYFILNKLPLGRYIYSVGGNEYAAYISGVKTDRIKMLVYILAAVLSAIAGLFLAAFTGFGFPRAASGYEFTAITAVVMGGIAFSGGKGNIVYAIVAVLILELIYKFIYYLGISPFIQGIIVGVILLITVYFNVSKNK